MIYYGGISYLMTTFVLVDLNTGLPIQLLCVCTGDTSREFAVIGSSVRRYE